MNKVKPFPVAMVGGDVLVVYASDYDALSAEVERLREALQAIYDTDYQAPHDATDDEVSTSRKLCIFRMRKQASAALSDTKEKSE